MTISPASGIRQRRGFKAWFMQQAEVMNKIIDHLFSLKVIGNPWVAYTDKNFSGEPTAYKEGEYSSVYYNKAISLLELVTEDLDNPQITLYEKRNHQGKSLVFNCDTSLLYGTFNDKASSHKVQRGAWVLYQHKNKGGSCMVAKAGRDLANYGWFNDRVTHIRPLKAGRPTIKAEVEWDKKKEHVKTVNLDSLTGVNYGSEKQTFTTEMIREYSGSVTESFNFSNSTQISVGTKIEVTLFGAKAENNINIDNTFTVEKGHSETKTTTNSVKVPLPASIPPHTKLTVNIVRKQVSVTVPVKLTITTGFTSKVEYGEYRCEDGNSIYAEYKEEKI
ncbi:epidermal differentiation-specific protein-like [Clarias gariepinus]|uniref:epidermal differentiation-specific protein-like n=1 Tax=Clarias gariepinus TaxID=13013 RepID=UPI00234C6D8E|nr:epidermal differentiation-specific protein-like [Clarias gariepinus]